MLGMKTCTQDYIDACRARVDADLRAYRKQVGKAPSKEFEASFFKGKLQVDKLPGWPNSAGASLKLPPERSVLKLSGGDDVKLGEADFVRLCKAFFTEIEKKYL